MNPKEESPRRRKRLGTALAVACAALCGTAPIATASNSDEQATHTYLTAQYRLLTALSHDDAATRGAETSAAARIARECPGVVSGMPREPSLKSLTAPRTPRVKGETARLTEQTNTIEDELIAAVERPGDSSSRSAEEAYAAEVRQLSWSNPAIAPTLQAATTARLEVASAPAPPFCVDARAWAQSGYRDLSLASREFEARATMTRTAEESATPPAKLLKPYENAADRTLIREINTAETRLLASAFIAVQKLFNFYRTIGFPRLRTEEPRLIPLGHGLTAAGTHFAVSSSSGSLDPLQSLGTPKSCHRSAAVSYSRPGAPEILIMGGPNNPICLSSPQYRHPALFCEVGIETIQAPVPAAVRSVRLVLADGRTIESRVVRIARRNGGPAGIYAQEVRGSASHAVSLVELNGSGSVVLTLKLSHYRCVKPRTEPEEFPTATALASGRTPEGEAFTISAYGRINGEPFLSTDVGVDPYLNEIPLPPGASKKLSWSLSLGCSPHGYAILYGILAPPGETVVAQTAQGAVPLNVVPVAPHLHAAGPLVYGVFSAVPSEVTVLAANGSTVYSENLQAKATEAAQFCEGYEEP